MRKNSLVRLDPSALHRLVAETRRAELVHLALWPVWLVTGLWLKRSSRLRLLATLPSAA